MLPRSLLQVAVIMRSCCRRLQAARSRCKHSAGDQCANLESVYVATAATAAAADLLSHDGCPATNHECKICYRLSSHMACSSGCHSLCISPYDLGCNPRNIQTPTSLLHVLLLLCLLFPLLPLDHVLLPLLLLDCQPHSAPCFFHHDCWVPMVQPALPLLLLLLLPQACLVTSAAGCVTVNSHEPLLQYPS